MSTEYSKKAYFGPEEADKPVVDRLGEIGKARGIPRAQIALAWLLHKPAVTVPIVGATKLHHLEEAVAALDVKLSDAEMESLEAPYVPHSHWRIRIIKISRTNFVERRLRRNLLIQVNFMQPDYIDFLIKRFESPDEVRTFEKGRFELIKIGGMTIGRATYEPGWKWSQHVAPVASTPLCQVEHIGMVISGQAACAMQDGRSYVMKPGDVFYIGPGHDSWVVGHQPYVSLHFLGAEKYAHD
jgi:hypothetical protein